MNYGCAFSQSELGKYFEWIMKCQVNLSKHKHCLNSGIREYLPSSITWQTWRKHDAKRGRGGKERLLARVLSFNRSGHNSTRRNRWRNEANDSKLQSSDSQKNSRDDTQSHCSKMVGFASPRSFEVILPMQPSKNVAVQYKERTCKCKSAGDATWYHSMSGSFSAPSPDNTFNTLVTCSVK